MLFLLLYKLSVGRLILLLLVSQPIVGSALSSNFEFPHARRVRACCICVWVWVWPASPILAQNSSQYFLLVAERWPRRCMRELFGTLGTRPVTSNTIDAGVCNPQWFNGLVHLNIFLK